MKLRDWFGQDQTEERLVTTLLRPKAAGTAAQLFAQAADGLEKASIDRAAEVVGCWVPGRIEVLGKHTDYCGGRSLLAAAERGFAMLAAGRNDNVIRVIDAARNESVEFALSESIDSKDGHWSDYFRTVARRVAKNFPNAKRGVVIAFASNLPASGGMSSSSALIVGAFLLLAPMNRLFEDELFQSYIDGREALAGYLGTVENGSSFQHFSGDRGVGTFGGSEDHTAILCGQPDKLVQYSFCPVRYDRSITFDDRYIFAIASSGVIAEKTGAARDKYNRLSLLVKAMVDAWQHETNGREPTLAAILASDDDAAEQLCRVLHAASNGAFSAQPLLDRLEHFQVEDQLIESLPTVLDPTTVGIFAELVGRSQQAAERFLANQTPETVHLVESAVQLGAHAASAFGAGFGGSVWALIDAADESDFLTHWHDNYSKDFPQLTSRTAFFATRPGPPAQIFSDQPMMPSDHDAGQAAAEVNLP